MAFFSNIAKLFCDPPEKTQAALIYVNLVQQSRKPVFYTQYGIPDTLDGRFEMIALHMHLMLHRLRQEQSPSAEALSRLMIEGMMSDMDRSVRELGAGDTGIARRVKAMAGALFGRLKTYDEALSGKEPICDALQRNTYGGRDVDKKTLYMLAGYVERNRDTLAGINFESLRDSNFSFKD